VVFRQVERSGWKKTNGVTLQRLKRRTRIFKEESGLSFRLGLIVQRFSINSPCASVLWQSWTPVLRSAVLFTIESSWKHPIIGSVVLQYSLNGEIVNMEQFYSLLKLVLQIVTVTQNVTSKWSLRSAVRLQKSEHQ
jgi:hypothetical protein